MSIESCIVRLPGTSKSYPFDEHRRDERGDLRYMIAHGATRRVGEAHRPVGRERAERESSPARLASRRARFVTGSGTSTGLGPGKQAHPLRGAPSLLN